MLDPYTDVKMDANLKAKQAAVKQVHTAGFLDAIYLMDNCSGIEC